MKTIRMHSSGAEVNQLASNVTSSDIDIDSAQRTRLKDRLKDDNFDILVTTYECYVSEHTWFKSRRWTYCVLDEGHKIKNSETNTAHLLQGISSLYRLSKPSTDTFSLV